MGLSRDVLRAIRRKGYRLPTPIQRRAIPVILSGQDLVGMARTGSGKTAAFVIPLIQRCMPRQTGVCSIRAEGSFVVNKPKREEMVLRRIFASSRTRMPRICGAQAGHAFTASGRTGRTGGANT